MAVRFVAMILFALPCSEGARMKHHFAAKGEAPLKEWESKICVTIQGGLAGTKPKEKKMLTMGANEKITSCRKWIADEEANCQEAEAAKQLFLNKRCETFREHKDRIEREGTNKPKPTIKRAAEACEPEVLDVCIKTTCPIECAINKIKKEDCDCAKRCKDSSVAMWGTGDMPCDEDTPFSECQENLHKALKVNGRNPEMEAVLREHTLKCMCVSWRSDATRHVCYEGSKGIKEGTKWCEFYDTSSWNNLVAKATDEQKNNFPKPQCDEFPYSPDASSSVLAELAKDNKQNAPLKEWEEKICVTIQGGGLASTKAKAKRMSTMGAEEKISACRKWIEEEETNCQEAEAAKLLFLNKRCETFRESKDRIERDGTNKPKPTIKRAAEACEPEVLDVCIKTSCPIECAINKIKKEDCDCAKRCKDSSMAMWGTGDMPCDEDTPFSECQENLHKALKVNGRNPEMEAVLREHTLKCMCVSWRSDATRHVCYEGSKGIKEGTKWCEFYDTSSWNNLVAKATAEQKKSFPKPECDEFPYSPDVGALEGKAAEGTKSGARFGYASSGVLAVALAVSLLN